MEKSLGGSDQVQNSSPEEPGSMEDIYPVVLSTAVLLGVGTLAFLTYYAGRIHGWSRRKYHEEHIDKILGLDKDKHEEVADHPQERLEYPQHKVGRLDQEHQP